MLIMSKCCATISNIGGNMNPLWFNELLKRIRKDATALDTLFNYYYPRIILHINRVYPTASAEDIAQEFFFKLLKTEISGYISKPTSWVFTICENIAKAKHNKESRELPASDLLESIATPVNTTEDIINKIQAQQIFKSVNDDMTKEIIYLHYWEGYSLKEIAVITGLSAVNVRKKHSRAIKILKKISNNVSQKGYIRHS